MCDGAYLPILFTIHVVSVTSCVVLLHDMWVDYMGF